MLHLRQASAVAVVQQKTAFGTRRILAQVALGTPARFPAFDHLLALTVGTLDRDEGHGPRHLLSAPEYRQEMRQRFESWAEITGTQRAA